MTGLALPVPGFESLAMPGAGRAAVSLRPVKEDPDAGLVKRAQAGDEAAFEALVRRHADSLYSVVARLLGRGEETEEVVQEAFIRAWRSIDRFKGDAKFFTWLYRIGVNESRRRAEQVGRHRERTARSINADSGFEISDSSQAPGVKAEQAELWRALKQAVLDLPPDLRLPLVLRDIEGLSTAEAAAVMELGEPAFKSRLHRARLRVRKSIAGLTGKGEE